MKDARRIKRRGKAIPMHQDGESVVEVPKALSVEVSQIGAFALPRAERLRIAQPLRAWLEENGRLRATIWPVRRQAVRRFLATCQAPPRRIRRPRPLSPLTWHLHLEDVIHELHMGGANEQANDRGSGESRGRKCFHGQ
ncbi:Cell division protein FtsX [Mesorhizobium loti]|nr:Cell division protein FtsX [Mesorhizobium loti]